MSSGDTVWIGAGVYREAVTVAMTSATVETSIIGDVDGAMTGDAGEVQWSAHTTNDFLNGTATILTPAGRDFLTFRNLVFISGTQLAVDASTTTSTNITFQDCFFLGSNGNTTLVTVTIDANIASNWTVDRCTLLSPQSSAGAVGQLWITLNRHTADYDSAFVVKNCRFLGSSRQVFIASGGAGVGFGGGVDVLNCTFMFGGGNAVRCGDANLSTSIPCTITNCAIFSGGTSANVTGQLIEDYCSYFQGSGRSNVTAGAHSTTIGAPLVHAGQELLWGGQPRPFGMPAPGSPLLGFGSASGGGNSPPSVDLLNRPRPSGMRLAASGTATAGAAKTLTDSGAAWGTNAWAGYTLVITGGTGSGQTKSIASNTATIITVDGNWKTNPGATSTYQVVWGDPSSTGTATAGTTTSLTDSNAAWGVNQWTGYILHIDAGTGSGQSLTVTSNTATVLSFATATAPDATSTYSLYKATGITTQDYAVGALERHDHAQRDAVTYDVGPSALKMLGVGDQELRVPVAAVSTTITVKTRWHATASNKPQAILLANGEIGVTTETKTATGAVDTWETLTFSAQTPTAAGIVIVRLIARPDAATDQTYFDTFAVT